MTSRTFTIATTGDPNEKRLKAFAQQEFPSYERFWQRRVVPITHRPCAITHRSDAELAAASRGAEDITIAQLHYTCLLHPGRVHGLLTSAGLSQPAFARSSPARDQPSHGSGSVVRLPKFDKVDLYLDWRGTYGITQGKAMIDFDAAPILVKRAWREVLDYLEDRWKRHLL